MVPLEFSDAARTALNSARLARRRRAEYIGVEHIALAVLDQAPPTALTLAFGGLPDLERLREELLATSAPVSPNSPMPILDAPYTQAAMAVLRGALSAADAFTEPRPVGVGYLLLGILCPVDERDKEPVKPHAATTTLRRYGLDEQSLVGTLSAFEPNAA